MSGLEMKSRDSSIKPRNEEEKRKKKKNERTEREEEEKEEEPRVTRRGLNSNSLTVNQLKYRSTSFSFFLSPYLSLKETVSWWREREKRKKKRKEDISSTRTGRREKVRIEEEGEMSRIGDQWNSGFSFLSLFFLSLLSLPLSLSSFFLFSLSLSLSLFFLSLLSLPLSRTFHSPSLFQNCSKLHFPNFVSPSLSLFSFLLI